MLTIMLAIQMCMLTRTLAMVMISVFIYCCDCLFASDCCKRIL